MTTALRNLWLRVMGLLIPLVFCFAGHAQDTVLGPAFKNEMAIVHRMMENDFTSFKNDTLTIYLWYYQDGHLQEKRVYYHPGGRPHDVWAYQELDHAESHYKENGHIIAYFEKAGRFLHGDYLSYHSRFCLKNMSLTRPPCAVILSCIPTDISFPLKKKKRKN